MRADGPKITDDAEPIGFAGFRSMITNVSADIALAERLGSQGLQHSPRPSAPTATRSAEPRQPTSRANWPLILVVVAAIGGGIVWMVTSNTSSYNSSTYFADSSNSAPPTYSPPSPRYVPSTPPPSLYVAPEAAPSYVAPPLPEYVEQRPAINRGGTLTQNEIVYCLAEEIRIDASEGTLDETSNYQIDRFNSFVDDYNSRCSNYQYYEDAMTAARSSIARRRREIQQEGASRFP